MTSINKEKAIDKNSICVFKKLSVNYKHKGIFLICDCFIIPQNLFIPFLLIVFQLGSCSTSISTNFPSFPCRLAMSLCCSGGQGQISRAFLTIQLVCILCLCFIPSFILCRAQSVPWTMRTRATLERPNSEQENASVSEGSLQKRCHTSSWLPTSKLLCQREVSVFIA